MYGYDPIFLEKRRVDEWLSESDDNILVMFDTKNLQFSETSDTAPQYKIFCLKKQFLFNPEIKDIFVKCALENGQIMVKKTYSTKTTYNNIGYYINKNVLLDIKSIKPSLIKERAFKISINTGDANEDNMYISKELLALSKIGLVKNKKIQIDAQTKEGVQMKKLDRKNILYKDDVYFEKLLSKALYDYSFKWDGPINAYLRYGLTYFYSSIFKQTYKVYGDTKDSAIEAIIDKISDLDRAFLEAAPRHEDSTKIYYRGMKQPFENLKNVGDAITVPNFMSITTNFKVALGFSGIGKVGQAKCCVYKFLISNGIPYINMINTTKYKHEQETLLPRNLKLTLINKSTMSYPFLGEIPVLNIRVSLQNNDQFKIYNGCSKFYVGKLIHLDAKSITDKVAPTEKKANEKKTTEKKPRIRCPNGTRKNKITGQCEAIITNNQATSQVKTLKQKKNLTRCPNGTRRNKISGLCEKK